MYKKQPWYQREGVGLVKPRYLGTSAQSLPAPQEGAFQGQDLRFVGWAAREEGTHVRRQTVASE